MTTANRIIARTQEQKPCIDVTIPMTPV